MELRSYPKSLNAGHKGVDGLLSAPVSVQEKIDGSQFSFGIIDDVLLMRSRNQMIEEMNPGMFREAAEAVYSIRDKLISNWTYRAEYLSKPKHNTLAYSRVPNNHLILFDIDMGYEHYMSWEYMAQVGALLGLETVPQLASGVVTLEDVKEFMTRDSCLGGTTIEGVVFKPLDYVVGADGKRMQMKYVSESFKAKHGKDWKDRNPAGKDIIQSIATQLRTQGWWEVAIARLAERGALAHEPKDIGAIIKEVNEIITEREEDSYFIHDALYEWAKKDVFRASTRGLAEWYKERLLEEAFNG